MVNFGLLAAEIFSLVWGTPANFNGFRVLAALLHSQTAALKTCIRQGGHHVGHWPTWALAHISSFFCLTVLMPVLLLLFAFCSHRLTDTSITVSERVSGIFRLGI